jgi:hypothetical protein
LVGIPEPVAAEPDIVGSYAEVKAAEPEAGGAASDEMEDVALAEAACEASMFPGMIEAVMGIVAAGVVPDPLIVGVDVRCRWVPGLVRDRMFRSGMRLAFVRSWAVSWYVSAANVMRSWMTLRRGSFSARKRGEEESYRECEKCRKWFH